MAELLTVEDTMKMNKVQIEKKLGKYAKELNGFGMNHKSSCEFLSSVMNLGIALYRKKMNKEW